MAKPARIIKDPDIMRGHPVIEGTRLTVWLIQEHVASGATEEDLLRSYPRLTADGIEAALSYAEEHGMVPFEDWEMEISPCGRQDMAPSDSALPVEE